MICYLVFIPLRKSGVYNKFQPSYLKSSKTVCNICVIWPWKVTITLIISF